MQYNGKDVYTTDTFDYAAAQSGDYVTQEVVDNAIDCPYLGGQDVESDAWLLTRGQLPRL